jgi:hypothetical protein
MAASSLQTYTGSASGSAVDRDFESTTDLPHPGIGQPAESRNEYAGRDALDRVEVHRRAMRNWIVTRFQDDLAGKPSDRRRAGCD